MVRIDMTEVLREKHYGRPAVGAHPAYVGYDRAARSPNRFAARPISVVLLTRWKRPTRKVFAILLQGPRTTRLTERAVCTVDVRTRS